MASLAGSDSQSKLSQRAVKEVYPVSRLVREVRMLLEGSFHLMWVEGEISNLAMPGSGHIYFTLKDATAQVRCAMFRNRNQHVRFTPENGMQVLLRIKVTLYEGRGEFQLVVEHMEEAGSGALQRAYEALKSRLGQEGLFDSDLKKTLPAFPKTIGIVSSPDGAAVHDILSVLKRRFPAIKVILYPVAVQGESSAKQLTEAVRLAGQRQECDVLIISRGGGSLEDLWSFNDEALAREIVACPIPTISAVGHEIDFTIADFVADVRAPTPSAAAELAVPDVRQWLLTVKNLGKQLHDSMQRQIHRAQRNLRYLQQRLPKPIQSIRSQQQWLSGLDKQLRFGMQRRVQSKQQQLDYLATRLKHPQAKIATQHQRLFQLRARMLQATAKLDDSKRQYFQFLTSRLTRQVPIKRIHVAQQRMQQTQQQLTQKMTLQFRQHHNRLNQAMRTLSAVSPLNTLERGYSISRDAKSGKVLQTIKAVQQGQAIELRLTDGLLDCEVKHKHYLS